MPVRDPKTCGIFVWLPSCLHFVVIIAGCACLIVFVFFNKKTYFAIIGLTLVGLLWLFWILTYLYRRVLMPICSPSCGNGGRIGDREGGSVENVVPRVGVDAGCESLVETIASSVRKVRFGDAVVMEEQEHEQHGIMSYSSSSSSSNIDDYHDISSPESRSCERPFSGLTP